MNKPLASLSLDLDNQWSYMKTHGESGWESLPTYLPLVIPRVLEFLARRNLKITFFIVGQDAALEVNQAALRSIAEAGHEIGNHSFHHEPWLHLYSEPEIEAELAHAEAVIAPIAGQPLLGFRGPGFSVCPTLLRVLIRRGYRYDASTFPTILGPLARAYYFKTAKLTEEEKQRRRILFGRFRDGLQPLKPYRWQSEEGSLTEIPVTTMPLLRIPIHVSYLLYLSLYSRWLALFYLRSSLLMCRLTGTSPSLLLHPLDFMGNDDTNELVFFPAMRTPSEPKVRLVGEVIDIMARQFKIVNMRTHAEAVQRQPRLLSVPLNSG